MIFEDRLFFPCEAKSLIGTIKNQSGNYFIFILSDQAVKGYKDSREDTSEGSAGKTIRKCVETIESMDNVFVLDYKKKTFREDFQQKLEDIMKKERV